jgi:hypothetical protein
MQAREVPHLLMGVLIVVASLLDGVSVVRAVLGIALAVAVIWAMQRIEKG